MIIRYGKIHIIIELEAPHPPIMIYGEERLRWTEYIFYGHHHKLVDSCAKAVSHSQYFSQYCIYEYQTNRRICSSIDCASIP